MRLLKFLTEMFDYKNPTFSVVSKDSDCVKCSFIVANSVHDFKFTAQYNLDLQNRKVMHFGFSRDDLDPIRKFFAARDWNEYPGKVFSGVIQGIPIALNHFKDIEILVGTALDTTILQMLTKVQSTKKSSLANIYSSSSFKKAVEKAAPGFKFSASEKLPNGDVQWVYKK